ncbi:MAG: PhoH family protein [Candidatus Thioglobus sp.]|nr:MAG: PhoH family protein [Candidatus Thioglobus sp.]KAA0456343.1 MAG: PhoH family protein [Candidatus Thioglobus sp.]
MNLILETNNAEELAKICGSLDQHLEIISKNLDVVINNKGDNFTLKGDNKHIAAKVLQDLVALSKSQNISISDIEMAIKTYSQKDLPECSISIKTKRKFINIRSKNQQKYVLDIEKKDCTFGIGPAGTGKTYLAVACAVKALENSEVNRIVLVRPAVEAGEKLGFLPGDMTEKVDPYLRPIYDALYEMLGFDKVEKLLEKNTIEVAPLAFMRGRTLNEAFVILDEAQNTTILQMKMFLTRLGFGSKMVITGDISQIDLANPKKSGLINAAKVLANESEISFCYFENKDVVRHNLVKRIVCAYEKSENLE